MTREQLAALVPGARIVRTGPIDTISGTVTYVGEDHVYVTWGPLGTKGQIKLEDNDRISRESP